MKAPVFVSFRWFCCAGAVSSSRTQYIPTSSPVLYSLCPLPAPFPASTQALASFLPARTQALAPFLAAPGQSAS